MSGVNKVILLGTVGQDPFLKLLTSISVLELRIATDERFKGRDGQQQERTEWHTVVLFGKRAESLSKLLSKGSQVYVEGRLQTRSWEDKSGNKRYATEVVATELVLCGSRPRRQPEAHEEAPADDDPLPF